MDSHDLVRPVKLLEGIQADLKRLVKLQELIIEKMYMDRLIEGMISKDEAEKLHKAFAKKICETISFNVTTT